MRILGKLLLDDFRRRHADANSWITSWVSEAEEATWSSPHGIKARYASASFLPDNVVIFNVKRNSYRMKCRAAYKTGVLKVVWIGTHAEYSKLK
ncbi:MAG: type II toxin-antitoxin system HigB family toxin [Gammaproteobacteria bacterium]|nr:type II toxin-antitoxin system HigB family toxin [Gammaproteobacteria bacterium]